MVTTSELRGSLLPLLTCLEDNSSPPEDKTDAYLRLAQDLAKENKQFVHEVCNVSGRLLSVITRDMTNERIDLSQAALQAVGYCLYLEQTASSIQESGMSKIIQDLCNVAVNSTDKNLCTRALWCLGKQQLLPALVEKKLPDILKTVEHALLNFASPTVEKEALEVIYRLLTQLPNEAIRSTAGQWSKLVYPLLISSAHKIREKALGILELGLQPILLARDDILPALLSDLKGGLLTDLGKCFTDKKEIFVLRAWVILVAILGEALHKSGSLINSMLKIPEQGFRSSSPNVQNMSYNAWICLTDNFALSPNFIGSMKKIKLLMMPLLLCSTKTMHNDIELARLQAWWHLVCTIKTDYTGLIFSEVCIPLLQYYFNVNIEPGTTPVSHSKNGMQMLTLPVTPVARQQTTSVDPTTPSTGSSSKNNSRRKTVTLNKDKFSATFVKQVMSHACEMLMEILAVDATEVKKSKWLTEHLDVPILQESFFYEHQLFFLAVVKSAFLSCSSYMEESVALSIWTNIVDRHVSLLQNGSSNDVDKVMAPLFLAFHDMMTSTAFAPNLVLKFLDVLVKLPTKYLLQPFAILSSFCSQGKPIFLLADILFNQLSSFKGSYVDERFHVLFEGLIDAGLDAPSQKLSNVHNVWLSLEGVISTVANVEDLWRFWSKVTDSVSDCVTKTSDVNQGDALDHDFSLMIALLTFPFKQLFAGGLPGATTKELDRDLAEFFQLFSRCASLVPTAEANTCVEELSNSLVTVVSHQKCKNVRFLDGICNFINVMMETFDFPTHNKASMLTSSVRGSLTPATKVIHCGNALGNLNSLVTLTADVLSLSYEVNKEFSGSIVAPAVTVLSGALSKLFAHLTIPQNMKVALRVLSKPLKSFISLSQSSSHITEGRATDKKYNAKFFAKIEKLWTDILTCLQSRYTAHYDSDLLATMSELLESTLCHPRRQLRNQTIMFWNATFAHSEYLDYPPSLRPCLQTVREKTPLTLPGWDKCKSEQIPPFDPPATLQDSEETTPKENIIKPQVVIANSPKRKHGSSSPGKLKGSFLHKAFSAEKADRLSPFKNSTEASASKRKSPASANVRRKLPLSLDSADENDFVVIAPSPKKKRLLTEHQKEVRKEKKLESHHPPLYNMLDQSQDGMQFSEWSQSMSQSFGSHNQDFADEPMNVVDPDVDQKADKRSNKEAEISEKSNFDGLLHDNADKANEINESGTTANAHGKTLPPEFDDASEASKLDPNNCRDHGDVNTSFEENVSSPEFIPSSQVPRSVPVGETVSIRSFISFQSLAAKKLLPGGCSQLSMDSEGETNEVDRVNLGTIAIQGTKNMETNTTDAHPDKDETMESSVIEIIEKNVPCRRTSPVSSRTRLRSKPIGTPTQSTETKEDDDSKPITSPECEQGKGSVLKNDELPVIVSSSEESDPQLFDTQILEDPPAVKSVEVTSSSAPHSDSNEDICLSKESNEIDAPSSPVNTSAVKLIHSNNRAVGSPLSRPTRGFSSPAASPTTGILKRNRKTDSPSPLGKTRHVSFAFPLREEKEFSITSFNEDFVEEAVKPNYTSIKATPTKSSAKTPQDCVFPDLVECSTPVEQILPSLATSRWSRGLGHLVHAQNIRTIGNLSALTEVQVEKLPIRSPKVSTLRRVLRNFHETHAAKSPKGYHEREMKAIADGNEQTEKNYEANVADGETEEGSSDLVQETLNRNNASSCEHRAVSSENKEHDSESVFSAPALPTDNEKMSTPRRSRAIVKPTTLFDRKDDKMENHCEMSNVNNTNEPPADDVCNAQLIVSAEAGDCCPNSESDGEPIQNMDIENENQANKEAFFEQTKDSEKCSHDGDNGMVIESIFPDKDEINLFVTAVGNLVSLKLEEELTTLPLNTLFLCHEQLNTVMVKVMSSIKSKCEQDL